MRVAYVASIGSAPVGVQKKITAQARATARLGADGFHFYVINPHRSGADGIVRFVRAGKEWPAAYLSYSLDPFRLVEASVPCSDYDVILVRYPLAGPSGVGFCRRHAVVTEHHTDEAAEKSAPLPAGATLRKRAYRFLASRSESTFGPRILARCRGLVGVTDEIRLLHLRRAGRAIPSVTMPNGIDVEAIPMTGYRPFDGRELTIVFVSSDTSPWHGVDRVLAALQEYRGHVRIRLHIVGHRIPPFGPVPATVEVQSHGHLFGPALDELLEQANLACSTLALHRIGLTQGCTLKTREYTARGLPFLIGYEDPDLSAAADDERFFLPVLNDDTPVDMEAVLDFASRLAAPEARARMSGQMRAHARQYMDWAPKMERYVSFVGAIRV